MLFSVMRDTIGRDFTTKQVKCGFRKICNEFVKRWTVIYHFTTILLLTPDSKRVPYYNLINQDLNRSDKDEMYLVESSQQHLHLVGQLCL